MILSIETTNMRNIVKPRGFDGKPRNINQKKSCASPWLAQALQTLRQRENSSAQLGIERLGIEQFAMWPCGIGKSFGYESNTLVPCQIFFIAGYCMFVPPNMVIIGVEWF
jgi:hypothetical protein